MTQLNIFKPDKSAAPPRYKLYEQAPNECWQCEDLTDADVRFYLAISHWIHEHGERDPDLVAIAAMVHKKRSFIYPSLARLEAAGQIGIERGHKDRVLWIWTTHHVNRRYQERAEEETNQDVEKRGEKRPRKAPKSAANEAQSAHLDARGAHLHARIEAESAHPDVRPGEQSAHLHARIEAESAHPDVRPLPIGSKRIEERENVTLRALALGEEIPEPAAEATPSPNPQPPTPPLADAIEPDPTPEQVAEWERQVADTSPAGRVDSWIARTALAEWRQTLAARAATSSVPPVQSASAPAPPPAQIVEPALTPVMTSWNPSVEQLGTEVLLRRVANPAFPESAIDQAAARLSEVFHDPESRSGFRKILVDLREASRQGLNGRLTVALRAYRRALSPGVNNPGAVFMWALRQTGGPERPGPRAACRG